ncbi:MULTISPECIES: hypothetical protein [unclassified Rhodanobacter]|nr:hypothetical protein [Rhodanobacter sp. OR444]TAN18668.1 MAG: hypothetical protein EPN35_03290 [Rhodanobacter sp.]
MIAVKGTSPSVSLEILMPPNIQEPGKESFSNFRTGIFLLLLMVVGGPVCLIFLTWQTDISLYPNVEKFVVYPLGIAAGIFGGWRCWLNFRAKDYKYRSKDGTIVQVDPIQAFVSMILMACLVTLIFGFFVRGMLRTAIAFIPSTSKTFDVTIEEVGYSRGCKQVISYVDVLTSQTVTLCESFGERRVGEVATVKESVGLLGTKLVRIKFDGQK